MVKSNKRQKVGFVGGVEALAMRAAARTYKQLGNSSQTSTNKRLSAAGSVLTTKYTPASSSKFKARKKLSKRKVRFYKKVKEVVQDQLGTIHLCRANPVFAVTWAGWTVGTTNGQGAQAITLGALGGNASYHNDIERMFETIPVAADRPESWLNLGHAILDIVVRVPLLTDPANDVADIDIYEMVCIKDIPVSIAGNPYDQLVDSINEMGGAYPSGVNIFPMNISELGVTPFQAYEFCKYWKMTGKKKLFISPGESAHVEYKNTYNDRKIFGSEADTLLAKAGTTKCYIVICNSVNRGPGAVDFNVNKRYSFKSQFIKTPRGISDNTA